MWLWPQGFAWEVNGDLQPAHFRQRGLPEAVDEQLLLLGLHPVQHALVRPLGEGEGVDRWSGGGDNGACSRRNTADREGKHPTGVGETRNNGKALHGGQECAG